MSGFIAPIHTDSRPKPTNSVHGELGMNGSHPHICNTPKTSLSPHSSNGSFTLTSSPRYTHIEEQEERDARQDSSYVKYYYDKVSQHSLPHSPTPLSRLYRSGETWSKTVGQPRSPRNGNMDGPDSLHNDLSTNTGESSSGSAAGFGHTFFAAHPPQDANSNGNPFTGDIDWQIEVTKHNADGSEVQGKRDAGPVGSVPGSPLTVRTKRKSLVDVLGELSPSNSPKSAPIKFFTNSEQPIGPKELEDHISNSLRSISIDSDYKYVDKAERNVERPSDERVSMPSLANQLETETSDVACSPYASPRRIPVDVDQGQSEIKSPFQKNPFQSERLYKTGNDSLSDNYSNSSEARVNSPYQEYSHAMGPPMTQLQHMDPSHVHALYGAPHFVNPQENILAQRLHMPLMSNQQIHGMYNGVASMRPGLPTYGQIHHGHMADIYTAYYLRLAEAQLATVTLSTDPAAAAFAASMRHYPNGSSVRSPSNSFRDPTPYPEMRNTRNSMNDINVAESTTMKNRNFPYSNLSHHKSKSHGRPESPLRDERSQTKYVDKNRRCTYNDNKGSQQICALLENLNNRKGRKLDLSDIEGHIVDFSMDQHGSRFIQQKLETAIVKDLDLVCEEVLPRCMTLMTDVFGNYVIQKLLEYGTSEIILKLSQKMTGHIVNLSLQMYGCRVTQKAIEVLDRESQLRLVNELEGHVSRCVKDQNGNHVIQKCIEHVPSEDITFILDSFVGNIADLAVHPYGCRVVQRIREFCSDEVRSSTVINEIIEATNTLARDQYGNYVVQHVLMHGSEEAKSAVVSKLEHQIVEMSQHKFASNVVEKILLHSSANQKKVAIESIMEATKDPEFFLLMLRDQYANYVIQRLLDLCNENQKNTLLDRIAVHLQTLKKYTYSKHIVARFEKLRGDVYVYDEPM